jgi:tetratricopeptide (TPR) repeat protein
VGHAPGEATALRGVGLVHRARGELEAAENHCAQAHLIATKAGDRLLCCYTQQALAKVWIRQGQTERAGEPLHQSLAISGELRDRLGATLVQRTIGELHLAAGRPDDALRQLEEAVRRWQGLGLGLWQARTLRDVGAAHAALGDAAAAHRAWVQARDTFNDVGTRERDELTSWRRQWGCNCPPDQLSLAPDTCSINADH